MKTDEEFLSGIKEKYELASKKRAKTKKAVTCAALMLSACFICTAALLTANGNVYDESKDAPQEEKENSPAELHDSKAYSDRNVKSGEELSLPADTADTEKITVTFYERKGGASEIYARTDDGTVYLLRFSDGDTVINSGRYDLIVCDVEYLGDGKYSAKVISYAET